jgi:hypothetical protein
LMPGTDFQFFSLVLNITSCGWPMEDLESFFEINFSETFPGTNGSELDEIIRDETKDRESRLIRVLSNAIRSLSPNAKAATKSLQTPLKYAVWNMQASIVSLLFQYNNDLDVTVPDEQGDSTIELAVDLCAVDAFRLIWDSTVKSGLLDGPSEMIKKILRHASSSKNGPVIKFLAGELFQGKIIPTSILEFAVCQETPSILELILDQEHNFGYVSTNGKVIDTEAEQTKSNDRELETFHLALKPAASLGAFVFLVGRGVHISHRDRNGNTAVHVLSEYHDDNSFEKLQLLLHMHPDLDVPNHANLTPLALAVRRMNIRGMERLLDAGASLDTKLAGNQTVLHIACCVGNGAAVMSLLNRRCRTWHKNSQGLTPKQVALASGHPDLADSIQKAINWGSSLNPGFPAHSGRLRGPENCISSFAHTKDHGKLPLRIPGDNTKPDTPSLKRQISEGDLPQPQVSTKRTRPS